MVLQTAFHFDALEHLDLVTNPDIIVIAYTDTTFHATADFGDVIFKTAQRF
jgi:hypothetical protein